MDEDKYECNKLLFDQLVGTANVDDLVDEETIMIFLLESPHSEEVDAQRPASGKTGEDMAHILFDGQEKAPLGSLFNKYKKMGIMNCCPFPMQVTAYKEFDSDDQKAFIKKLENLRHEPFENFGPDRMSAVELIIQDLHNRFVPYMEKKIIIIPCGRFAERVLEKIEIPRKWTSVPGVPHASRHQWSFVLNHYKPLLEVLSLFKKHVIAQ